MMRNKEFAHGEERGNMSQKDFLEARRGEEAEATVREFEVIEEARAAGYDLGPVYGTTEVNERLATAEHDHAARVAAVKPLIDSLKPSGETQTYLQSWKQEYNFIHGANRR